MLYSLPHKIIISLSSEATTAKGAGARAYRMCNLCYTAESALSETGPT